MPPKHYLLLKALLLNAFALCCHAFPPAPMVVLSGLVRDEFGDPWSASGAAIIVYFQGQEIARGPIEPDLDLLKNYRLNLAMDSGMESNLYRTNALKPYTDISLAVEYGNQVFLPIELESAGFSVQKPGSVLTLNVTMGEDSDLDGLPDKWEEWQLALIGIYRGMASFSYDLIKPDDDLDEDGCTNRTEYLAGTYVLDQDDRFALEIIGIDAASGRLQCDFLAVKDRVYGVQASTDGLAWQPHPFHIDAPTASAVDLWKAPDVTWQSIFLDSADGSFRFFRLVLRH